MEITEKEGAVFVATEDDIDLVKTFECGQCFRWEAEADGSWTGVAMGKAANIRKVDGGFEISGTKEDFETVWLDYLDFRRDYRTLRANICIDDYMKKASDFGAGIRILNQDRWETLCSFIISQCNNIPRIKKIVETLCRMYGDEIDFRGEKRWSFPSAERIAALTAEDLAPLRSGYRAPYIIAAAKAVASGEIDLEALSKGEIAESRKTLKTLPGIGDKVADCVLLFSLRMPKAFPVDVWMKKAIAEHYPDGFDPSVFGENAGLAQQYMFYYQRSGGNNKSA